MSDTYIRGVVFRLSQNNIQESQLKQYCGATRFIEGERKTPELQPGDISERFLISIVRVLVLALTLFRSLNLTVCLKTSVSSFEFIRTA